MNIIINRDGENHGPYDVDQIKALLGDGTLTGTDLAWHDDSTEWLPLGEVLLKATPLPTPRLQAPPPPTKDSLPLKMIGLLVGCIVLVGGVGVVLNQGPYSDPSQPQLAALCMFFVPVGLIGLLVLVIVKRKFTTSQQPTVSIGNQGSLTAESNVNGSRIFIWGLIILVSVLAVGAALIALAMRGTTTVALFNNKAPSVTDATPSSSKQESSLKRDKLFEGKWHYIEQDGNGNTVLCENITSDGETIRIDFWMPEGSLVTVTGKLSASKITTQTDQGPKEIQVASFRDPQQTAANLLMNDGDGTYALSYQGGKSQILLNGSMQFPTTEDNSTPTSQPNAANNPAMSSVVGLYAGSNRAGFEGTIEFGSSGKFLVKDPSLPGGRAFGDWALRGNMIDCYLDGQKAFTVKVQDDGKILMGGTVWDKVR